MLFQGRGSELQPGKVTESALRQGSCGCWEHASLVSSLAERAPRSAVAGSSGKAHCVTRGKNQAVECQARLLGRTEVVWDMGELCRCPACAGAGVKSLWVGGKDSIRILRSRDHTRAVQMAAEEKGDPEGDVLHPWLCVLTHGAGCQPPW